MRWGGIRSGEKREDWVTSARSRRPSFSHESKSSHKLHHDPPLRSNWKNTFIKRYVSASFSSSLRSEPGTRRRTQDTKASWDTRLSERPSRAHSVSKTSKMSTHSLSGKDVLRRRKRKEEKSDGVRVRPEAAEFADVPVVDTAADMARLYCWHAKI